MLKKAIDIRERIMSVKWNVSCVCCWKTHVSAKFYEWERNI